MGGTATLPLNKSPGSFTQMKNPSTSQPCFTHLASVIRIGLRFLIAGVFIYAACEKIWDPEAFAVSVSNYRLLPEVLIYPVALILPPLELICGLMLIIGRWPAATTWLALLGGVFIVAQTQALIRGLDIQCGCFGSDAYSPLTIGKLMTNLLLFAVLIYLLRWEFKPFNKRATHE